VATISERRLSLADPGATEALAARIAGASRAGDAILLAGPLGAGKTTFARGFLRALGERGEVPSPTFTLVQVYELPRATVWHVDLYRLRRAAEAAELGLDQGLAEAILLVEWGDRFPDLWPDDRLEVRLAFASDPDAREARLVGRGTWAARLARLLADV
jgi:tRNA threonylcarbamoyladenosine biosynthesis protein TsaE